MGEAGSFRWPDDWLQALPEARRSAAAACYSMGIDFHEVEDMVQVVSLKLLQASQKTAPAAKPFASPEEVGSWAWVVARNLALDLRRKRVRGGAVTLVEPATLAATAAEPAARDGNIAEYLEKITDLQQREAVRLRFLEDLGFEEIAARQEVSVTTAFNLVKRGLATLRRRMNDV